MCKTTKNTWQPLLPLGFDRDEEGRTSEARTAPYVDYCSQLIMNHLNNPHNGQERDERNLPTQILPVDIKSNASHFIEQIAEIITHMVIEGTCLRNTAFLTPFNPSAQQSDVILREIVYLMLSVREIVKRIWGENEPPFEAVGKALIFKIRVDISKRNIFELNL